MANLLNTLGFDRLPRSDRLELVQDLWGSIAAEGPPALTEAQRRELERRVAEDDANPDDVIPWEQVKARTAARLGAWLTPTEVALHSMPSPRSGARQLPGVERSATPGQPV